ncbi:MAG: hypothetical protein HUU41_10840 [Bryobacteraceae bacterium]|nr:hypothetical protein [Bryobacterales bacterium]MEB2363702.1 hypothetical protein [Bryobacterales bacterium]NUN01603.1 hypothetical protein [Bryobacteraceae bacterium]
MIRFVTIALIAIVLITLLRFTLGLIAKAFSGAIDPGSTAKGPRGGKVAGGELKKDPVCGTYVPVNSALSGRTAAGETVYFCSERCRVKFLK